MRARLLPLTVLALAAVSSIAGSGGAAVTQGTTGRTVPVSVERYGVFERSIRAQTTGNPWDDTTLRVSLRSPSGKTVEIGGFFVGNSTWLFRYAPSELGEWAWTARLRGPSTTRVSSGRFKVVRGSSPGFVRRSPFNAARWSFTNGSPYYPIGINDCTTGANPLSQWSIEGDFRQAGHDALPAIVPMATYMRVYGAAFNLFRWGPDNCSFRLYTSISSAGNTYSAVGGRRADLLFQALRAQGFRIELVLFGNQPPFAGVSPDRSQVAALQRYVRYMVDRYGAYVDFWELMNESNATAGWYDAVGGYLRSGDPYKHPVGTSFSRPDLDLIDFGADHWYETESPLESDRRTWETIQGSTSRKAGKPILIDEQGNIGRNWDESSAERMRVRSWTAFFAEGALVFWNTTFAKDYINENAAANLYLGRTERQYLRTLKGFTAGFDRRARIVGPTIAGAGVRGYGLVGPRDAALYLVSADRGPSKTGVSVTVRLTRGGVGTWIDPGSGRVLRKLKLAGGSQTLGVPPFAVDVAFKLTPR